MIDRIVVPGLCHGISPICYGYQECSPSYAFGPAVRSYYLLHYICAGSGTLYKDGQAYPVNTGDIFVILPGETTTYQASGDTPWVYCWLGFHCPNKLDFLQVPVLRQTSAGHIFEQIRQCAEAEQGDFRIFSLTYELLRQLSAPAKRSVENYAVYARTHLENMYMAAVTIEDLANTLHIDRRHLTNIFRKSYGISPHAFLMELRLNKAREFLRSGCSVTDAAAMAGFSDLPNFSKKYKSRFGLCPRDEKEQTRHT